LANHYLQAVQLLPLLVDKKYTIVLSSAKIFDPFMTNEETLVFIKRYLQRPTASIVVDKNTPSFVSCKNI